MKQQKADDIKYCQTQQGKTLTAIFQRSYPLKWLNGQGALTGIDYRCGTKIISGNVLTKTRTCMWKQQHGQALKIFCRCHLANETDIHILQSCPFVKNMICKRHNDIVNLVASKTDEAGFTLHKEPWFRVNNTKYHPVVDVSVCYEDHGNRMEQRFNEKEKKYSILIDPLKEQFGLGEVKIMALVIGARGGWPKKK